MKKAEEYIDISKISYKSKTLQISVIEKWIKQAQIEAIEHTVKRCAEEANIINNGHKNGVNTIPYEVDKQSILDIGNKIKEEL